MGLLEDLDNSVMLPGFGTVAYRADFKHRPHISKVKLDDDSGTVYLKIGDSVILNELQLGVSYVAALGVSYDLLLSVYDVNSRSLITGRLVELDDSIKKKFMEFCATLNKTKRQKNLEARIIGLQSTQNLSELKEISIFIREIGASVCEVDLFGQETRNIAIDAHRGMSFDILTLNRLYRPGELTNSMTKEQFERAIASQL